MRAISSTHSINICSYFLPLSNVYRNANDCASRVMQLYDSQPIIYSANESLNAITSVLLFTFLLMARKLYSDIGFMRYGLFISEFFGLFVYCVAFSQTDLFLV